MIHYGRAPFLDRFPNSRVPSYPRHKGPLTSEVVVVGGGLTGCATAYAFAAAGIKVTLVEADRIGRGSTGASPGGSPRIPASRSSEVEKTIGLRPARHAFHAWRRAALDFAALLRRLDIACHLEPHSALTVALDARAGRATQARAESPSRCRARGAGPQRPRDPRRSWRSTRPSACAAAKARRSIRIARAWVWRRPPPSAARGSTSARR